MNNVLEIEKYYKEKTLNTVIKTNASFITIGNSIANSLANSDGLAASGNIGNPFVEALPGSVLSLNIKNGFHLSNSNEVLINY